MPPTLRITLMPLLGSIGARSMPTRSASKPASRLDSCWLAREICPTRAQNCLPPPPSILPVSVGVAAACLGLEHEIGTVEKGKRADLVVVDGDPLADLKILQDPLRIRLVLKDGVTEVQR